MSWLEHCGFSYPDTVLLLLASVAAAGFPVCGVGTLPFTLTDEEKVCLRARRAAEEDDSLLAASILLHVSLQEPVRAEVEADIAAIDGLGKPLPAYFIFKWSPVEGPPGWLVEQACERWRAEDFSPDGPSPDVVQDALHSNIEPYCTH